MALAAEHCRPCTGEDARLHSKEVLEMIEQLDGEWLPLAMERKLCGNFQFKDYASALSFVNRVSAVAEAQNHHPDISFGWGYVEIILTTHAAQGLTRNDFILAAQIDLLLN